LSELNRDSAACLSNTLLTNRFASQAPWIIPHGGGNVRLDAMYNMPLIEDHINIINLPSACYRRFRCAGAVREETTA